MTERNPPAFPRTGEGFGNPKYDDPGMSLRDWFAGQAAMGLLAQTPGATSASSIANEAYMVADAMLSARLEGEEA